MTDQADIKKQHKPSKGEKRFDLAVYSLFAGVGVFVATLPITYWVRHGKGKEFFKSASKWLTKFGVSEESAGDVMLNTSLSMAGNIAIVPIKIAENNKAPIVDKLNKLSGETVDPDAPKPKSDQTWISLIKGRLLAWATVLVSIKVAIAAFGRDGFERFEEKFSKNAICKPISMLKGKPVEELTHTGKMVVNDVGELVKEETKLFRYGKIASLDVFATTAATIILYLGSRFFAKVKKPAENNNTSDMTTTPSTAASTQHGALPEPTARAQFVDKLPTKVPLVSHAQKVIAQSNQPQTVQIQH